MCDASGMPGGAEANRYQERKRDALIRSVEERYVLSVRGKS